MGTKTTRTPRISCDRSFGEWEQAQTMSKNNNFQTSFWRTAWPTSGSTPYPKTTRQPGQPSKEPSEHAGPGRKQQRKQTKNMKKKSATYSSKWRILEKRKRFLAGKFIRISRGR